MQSEGDSVMDSVQERVAYLQGLANGLELEGTSQEGRMLVEIIDVLGAIAGEMEAGEESQSALESYIESVDDDLINLEDEVYGFDEDDLPGDGVVEYWELECPYCGVELEIEDDSGAEWGSLDLICPNCHHPIDDPERDLEPEIDRDRLEGRESGGHPAPFGSTTG